MSSPAAPLDPETSPSDRLKVGVIVASTGRPAIVAATLGYLVRTQTLRPAAVILSCVRAEDAGTASDLPQVQLVLGPAGLPRQRNAGLAALPADMDIVVFFDDDFVAAADWLDVVERAFRRRPDLSVLTGRVLADGIKGPGIPFDDAVAQVEAPREAVEWSAVEPFSPYGCNMAFRRSAIEGVRFDERLVLYGWLEDRDFGARVVQRTGNSVKLAGVCGVHMGVKSGRVPGVRLGYSQVINPLYLRQKRSMTTIQVCDHIGRNVLSNFARCLLPEPYIDRLGRLRGNLIGAFDALRGRLTPERAATL
jgi:hypothetical protein